MVLLILLKGYLEKNWIVASLYLFFKSPIFLSIANVK